MSRRQTSRIAAAGFLLLAVIGLTDTLTLLPTELAPSSTLLEVWTSIAARKDLPPVLIGPALWGLACLAVAAWHLRPSRPSSAVRSGAIALVVLGALALLHQGAAFGMNLWVSNHLPPFEGGSTAVGNAVALTGAVALVVGVLVLAGGTSRQRKEKSAA